MHSVGEPMTTLTRRLTSPLAYGLSVAAVCLAAFWPTLIWMAERFSAPDAFYSHGWLIPPVSAWLIWQRRETLSRLAPRASYAGLALLVPSLLLHTVATWWRIGFLGGFAMVGVIGGLVWTLWGRQVLWALRCPLAFLLFMVPLPSVLLLATSFQMKLMAAHWATRLIQWLGIPAQLAGSTIQVSGMHLVIDDTCSGLRSLISLLALATLWTSLLPPSTRRWQRFAVVASSVPIALAANVARIIVLALLAVFFGPAVAQGFLHYGSGLVVFGVAVVALTGVNLVVQRWSHP